MKKRNKKLVLAKETVRNVEQGMHRVGGGKPPVCPDTSFYEPNCCTIGCEPATANCN